MPYPSTISTFTNPSPSDRLSTTPHSTIETNQNTALTELETFVGTISSTAGTLIYDIRSSNSNGGGHVQGVNKGGTAQTSYTKGDILVATSSSVLTKLAVSANDNDFLAVNSSVAAGLNWTPGVTSGQVQAFAFSWGGKDSGTGSVYSIYPAPCVLSYGDGQLFGFRAANANTIAAPALSVSSLVSKTIKNADGTALVIGQIPASTLTLVQYNGSQSYFGVVSQTKNSKMVLSAVKTGGYPSTASSDRYFYPFDATAPEASEGPGFIAPYGGTIKNMYFYLSTVNSTNANSAQIVININGSTSGLVKTIDTTVTPANNVYSDLTHSATVAAGDKITFHWSGGNGIDTIRCMSVELDA